MTASNRYVDSGPRCRQTMVRVLALPGCVAVGPTTEEALAATPAPIRADRRFLHRHGEPADSPDAPVATRVAEHVAEGDRMGDGSPHVRFGPDLEPITDEETETHLRRCR